MARIYTPAAEALLEEPLTIYGGQGSVILIDYMGGDDRIVQAARVSYGAGTRTAREDRGLIRHLVREHHTSPLEKVRLEIAVRGVPLPIATQWIRHRMGSFNFLSYRFSEVEATAQFRLEPADVRAQSAANKQVGEGPADHAAAVALVEGMEDVQRLGDDVYRAALAAGISREQARLVLPQTTTTSFYWTVDLHNLFHFLRLRMAWDAQAEIQEPARAVAKLARAVAPLAYEAFEDYILNAVTFSAQERVVLADLISRGYASHHHALRAACDRAGFTEREVQAFAKKLEIAP